MLSALELLSALTLGCAVFLFLRIAFVCYYFYQFDGSERLKNCALYFGRVYHTRLKGGAVHAFNYPIFFAYIDLQEIKSVDFSMWPLFGVNMGWFSFISFDPNVHHLKGYNTNSCLDDRVRSFVTEKMNASNADSVAGPIRLLTHLTYFGYCFNPVSFYYIFDSDDDEKNNSSTPLIMVAEVGNTPWIEQHTYVLHQDVEGVKSVKRTLPTKDSSTASSSTSNTIVSGSKDVNSSSGSSSSSDGTGGEENGIYEAVWDKAFHVSPFMEMDYSYWFRFSTPGEQLSVKSKLIKRHSEEVWFSANFTVDRAPFTPLNLLYALVVYPLHTRIIQLWIHWEAVKIYRKGVPFFNHPDGTDVDFGFGISGKKISDFVLFFASPWLRLIALVGRLFSSHPNKQKTS